MLTTGDVKAFLEACRRAKSASVEHWKEYEETRDAAALPSVSFDRYRHGTGGHSDPTAGQAEAVQDKAVNYLYAVLRADIYLEAVLELITCIDPSAASAVLVRRYMSGDSWNTVTAAVGFSRGYCVRLVRQAIKDIAASPAADTIIRRAYEELEENTEAFKSKL